MNETTKNTGDKLSVSSTKTLTLKRSGVEQGVVRQSFSHGRSKAVVVEKVKRRVAGPGEARQETAAPVERAPVAPKRPIASPAARAPATPAVATPAAAPAKPSGVVLRTLTEEERSARAHALADARLREAEERKIAEEEARIRQSREEIEKTERAKAESRKRDEEDRRKHDEETKRKADEVAKKRFGADTTTLAKPGTARPVLEADDDEAPRARRGSGAGAGSGAPARPAPPPKTPRAGAEKRRGRLTVVNALSADEIRPFGCVVPPARSTHERPPRQRAEREDRP